MQSSTAAGEQLVDGTRLGGLCVINAFDFPTSRNARSAEARARLFAVARATRRVFAVWRSRSLSCRTILIDVSHGIASRYRPRGRKRSRKTSTRGESRLAIAF